MAKLSKEKQAEVKKLFLEFSGGFHPGEAGDERKVFQEEYSHVYGEEALDEFLDRWGDEESEKDSEDFKKKEAERKAAFKRRIKEIAKSLVTRERFDHQNVVRYDDVTLYMEHHPSKTVAKAEWADLVWLFEKLLERGAEEAGK